MSNRLGGFARVTLAIALMGLITVVMAATFRPAQLVLDFETSLVPVGSHPRMLCSRADFSTMWTKDDNGMVRLWRTGGTAATTVLLKDMPAGTDFTDYTCAYAGTTGAQFIVHWENGQYELLTTNGTRDGTIIVLKTDIFVPNFAGVAGLPVFAVGQDGDSAKLFSSDGTVAGTRQFADLAGHTTWDISLAFRTSIESGGRIYFVGDGDLWQTDGTGAGTHAPLL